MIKRNLDGRKMCYEDCLLFKEALSDLLTKYDCDVKEITDKYGAVRIDVDNKYSTNLLKKQSIIENIIKQIDKGIIDF